MPGDSRATALEPALEPGDFADSFMPGAASRSEAHLATQAAE